MAVSIFTSSFYTHTDKSLINDDIYQEKIIRITSIVSLTRAVLRGEMSHFNGQQIALFLTVGEKNLEQR
jgi:hypothetical protein